MILDSRQASDDADYLRVAWDLQRLAESMRITRIASGWPDADPVWHRVDLLAGDATGDQLTAQPFGYGDKLPRHPVHLQVETRDAPLKARAAETAAQLVLGPRVDRGHDGRSPCQQPRHAAVQVAADAVGVQNVDLVGATITGDSQGRCGASLPLPDVVPFEAAQPAAITRRGLRAKHDHR